MRAEPMGPETLGVTCTAQILAQVLLLLFLYSPAAAQARPGDPTSVQLIRPVTAPIDYGGTYHLATGTWTRPPQSPAPMLGTQGIVVYNNTSPSFYFGTSTHQFLAPMSQGHTLTDEGRIPSTSGPSVPSTWIPGGYDAAPGCHDAYTVSGFRIAYCTDQTSLDVTIGFQEAYFPCAALTTPQTITLVGLPAAPAQGIQSCWTIDVDLTGSSASFVMAADGDGVYSGTPADNLFGWSFTVTSPVVMNGYAGPLYAGAFEIHTGTDGTRWDIGSASPPPIWPLNQSSGAGGSPELGTGMSTQDVIRVDSPGGSGCGNNNIFFSSLYMQVWSSDGCPSPPLGSPFCFGDATSTVQCPCSNSGASGHGCQNSASTGGSELAATGSPVLDDVVFDVVGELPTATSVFLQGDLQLSTPLVFGDGLRCVGGHLKRLYVKGAQGGQVSAPTAGDPSITQRSAALGDPLSPGMQRYYQVYYRDPSSSFCPPPTGNTWNISNATAITW